VRDLAGQLSQLRGGWRTGAMQARFALWLLDVLVHAVEPQHVKVDIQVERAAEALDQRHRAALRRGAVDARLTGARVREWLSQKKEGETSASDPNGTYLSLSYQFRRSRESGNPVTLEF